jgi:Protein of unknown function, DUF481
MRVRTQRGSPDGEAPAGIDGLPGKPRSRALVLLCLAAVCLTSAVEVGEAQKTDSVWIRNGDQITGEVKTLFRGRLKYSTDDLGTIYIEWDKVDRIYSPRTFEVELESGEKFYGILRLARSSALVLSGDTIPLSTIVAITPIRRTFLARVDGYLDLGLSYQKAHSTFQLTSGAKAVYRARIAETSLEYSSFAEARDDADETGRFAAGFTERVFIGLRWSAGVGAGYERNDELDLAGRLRILAFGARTLSKSNHVDLWASGGLVVTQENYFSTDSTSSGFEGYLGASFSAFRYDRPRLDANVTSSVFPSISIPGRVRLDNTFRVSYELVADFMLTVTLFDSFDSKPQSAGAPRNDFGTTLAISYTF